MSASAPSALQSKQPSNPSDTEQDGVAAGGVFSAARLEALYRQYASRLTRQLSRRVGREDASEAIQEAFAKLAGTSSAAHEQIECPEAFVTAVATNVLRDRARAAARRALQHHRLALEPSEIAHDPHRLFESREALRAIERALAKMNPRRRRIFMLHRFEQFTYAEIGGEVGMSEKGVKKQMAKALMELRRAAERPE